MGRFGWICVLVLAASCSGPKATAPSAPADQVADPRRWELDDDEKAWVEQKKTSGGLRVVSTELEGAYSSGGASEPTGFHADLARALGAFLGLPVSFRTVAFEQYFSKDGVVPPTVTTDPQVTYQPDAFRQADLAAFNFSDLPWREKLMDFHRVFPTRVVLVTPRGREISQLADLEGRKVVVFANTSHELYLRQLKANLALGFTVVSVPFGTDLFGLIRQGGADAMVRDANGVMMYLQKNPDFNVTLPLMPTEWSQWALPKGNPVLGSLVEKFLVRSRATGELSALWQKSYGMTFEAYEALIGDDPPPVWDDQDQEVLAGLARTGLRVAIDQERTIYEPQPGAPTRGITYNLLLEVAKRLGVPLKLRTVTFGDYFLKDGRFPDQVKTDPGFTYQPDLLGQVDLYADTFSPLDWRKKFLSFVSLYPSQLVWLARKDDHRGPEPGRKVALLAQSSYQDWARLGGKVRPQDTVLTTSGDEAIRMVSTGQADLTVSDANLALGWLTKYPNVTFFPASTEVQDLSWAVAKDNEPLRRVLSKALDSLRTSGAFATIWHNYYGVTLEEYLGLLTLQGGP